MKKLFLTTLLAISLVSCKSSKIGESKNVQLRFLDDYTIAKDLDVDGTKVGGLSGIDYHDGTYYLVSDQASDPRFYKANIKLDGEQIDTIVFSEVIKLETSDKGLRNQHLDMESILYDPENENLIISSEGSVNNDINPMVFTLSQTGKFIDSFAVPKNFLAKSEKKPRENGTFEGLAHSYDKKGVWVAMELPLKTDGPKPKLFRTKSPVRITYYNKETKKAEKQFPYLLDPITKIPWMYFAVDGVTDLLEYAPDKFLVLERGFASGHGSNGNTIRIYDVDARLGTNTLGRNNLNVTFYNPAKKELVFDFKRTRKHLSEGILDNIEGITFGPILPNGNRSIILISDNNFNTMGHQLNQVILMEFKPKK